MLEPARPVVLRRRPAGVLCIDAVHEDVPFTKTMRAAIAKEIRDLGKWLEVEVEVCG